MSWTPLSPWRPIPGTGQMLAFTATAVTSTAFDTYTQAVQISATANCHVRVGAGATNKDMFVKASDPPYILRVGNGEVISVVQDTAGGNLFVIELTH
ncbi:hypothetical protein F0160_22665 [Paraburkholderia sp. JPY303]|uniref:hypothetical protein n=1 Tax=Paraburkholderia atlantica TaxID=2654982 RepID=UPI001C375C43|nr:hypothetical protein [Paraburkholderia atlantica]NUY33291.1 hypothetical protein [Paraburkholderia atlantica]